MLRTHIYHEELIPGRSTLRPYFPLTFHLSPLTAYRSPFSSYRSLLLPIFCLGVKAGAGFVAVQVVVSKHQGAGIALLQFFKQFLQGLFLCLGSRVGRMSLCIQSSLVTYPYGMLVVFPAVCTCYAFRPSLLYRAVPSHYIVVAYSVPAQFSVPGIYLLGGRALPGPYARAMQDDK